MKQFKTIGPPVVIVKTTAHIDLTLKQWEKDCKYAGNYDRIMKEEVERQLGWTGPFMNHSAFHYLPNNRGVRLTVTYEREEAA